MKICSGEVFCGYFLSDKDLFKDSVAAIAFVSTLRIDFEFVFV